MDEYVTESATFAPVGAVESQMEGWQQDFLHVTVVAAGSVTLGSWWRFDFSKGIAPWRLYLDDGEGAALDFGDGDRYEIPPRVPVLVPPGAQFRTRAWRPVRHVYLHFEIVGLQRSLARRTRPLELRGAEGLRRLLAEIGDDLLRRRVGGTEMLRLRSAALEAVAQGYRLVRTPDEEVVADSPRYGSLRQALRLIHEEYARPLTRDEMAVAAGLSVDHFGRRFAEAMGMTPASYLTRHRLRMAAERLAHTDDRVESIAAKCGFPSRSHFARAFATAYGHAPTAYRRTSGESPGG